MTTTLLRRRVRTRLGVVELVGGEQGLAWVQLPLAGSGATREAHLARWFGGPRIRDDRAVLQDAVAELEAWDAGDFAPRETQLDLRGTPFQLDCWRALRRVPAGSTVTYGGLAARAGRPRATRAVGSAMRCNPVPLLVPCHRVLAAVGLGGFAGGAEGALDLKSVMLRHEGALLR